ncbi:hypothetical protein Sliba_53020 [Streptomyces nigrescens]|uniref:Secreted protein n=1 Tax=Streptomyces nigrescens TaxID=1920 RepID=A0A640TMW4_STRNI|nr:hypothetical protein Sliba_53020 [Streptomyces libani subsp. libani]GGV95477.1 hypothetical protein GCM10010500_35950 [Streptomyces libani subsp. libani]
MRDKVRTSHRGGALRRTAAAASLTLIAAAVPVALATPASASPGACTSYLAAKGYKVGPVAKRACAAAAGGEVPGDATCWHDLVDLGVKGNHAEEACGRA